MALFSLIVVMYGQAYIVDYNLTVEDCAKAQSQASQKYNVEYAYCKEESKR